MAAAKVVPAAQSAAPPSRQKATPAEAIVGVDGAPGVVVDPHEAAPRKVVVRGDGAGEAVVLAATQNFTQRETMSPPVFLNFLRNTYIVTP